MEIAAVTPSGLEDCQAIYAQHVLAGTGTFEEIPPSLEEIIGRHAAIAEAGYGWLEARDATGILGFGYYGQYRNRSGYRFAAEDSLYVRPAACGRGVGRALLTGLLAHATGRGFTQMLAVIGDSANAGSIGVHARQGFNHVGTMKQVGFKFGRWLDVVIMQKSLV